jgi:hypothetical protein
MEGGREKEGTGNESVHNRERIAIDVSMPDTPGNR